MPSGQASTCKGECRNGARDQAEPRLGTVQEPDTQRAEAVLDRAEKVARELDVTVEAELLQAREAGPAIVDEIAEWKADLVVIGLQYRERFDEFYMGKTAPYILREAPCRALLFREPRE